MNTFPKRCLLKLSGEILLGTKGSGISEDATLHVAEDIKKLLESGLELGIVIGGGNLFRGIEAKGKVISRKAGDHIGMLATLMNAIALQEALFSIGCKSEIFSGFECPKIAGSIYAPRIQEALKKDKMVLFAGGTGNPFFTTDTASVLRANEIGADLLIKATKVSFVYDRDPKKDAEAKPFLELDYRTCIEKQLNFMDATALLLAEAASLKLFVCDMTLLRKSSLKEILSNKQGTWIK